MPLIDGPLVSQRMTMSASPNASMLTLVVHDDSVLLNQVESVSVFEELAASGYRTRSRFRDAGCSSASGRHRRWPPAEAWSALTGQRGTPMGLLRELARRHGMVPSGNAYAPRLA